VIFTKNEARRADETVQLTMARSQHVKAATTEGQSACTPVGQRTDPLDPLREEAPDVRQDNVLVPLILERQKRRRIPRPHNWELDWHPRGALRKQRYAAEACPLEYKTHIDRYRTIAHFSLCCRQFRGALRY
jgi:hypothetical protein